MSHLKRPLTKDYADFCQERNRYRSPFLRLPGELRNKVYDYVLSSVTISVFPPPPFATRAYQLHAHMAGPVTGLAADPTASAAMALTRVSRQIYAETRLSPLKLFTFHISSDGSFGEFLQALSSEERDAITTVQVSTPDAAEGGRLFHCIVRTTGNGFVSQGIHLELLEWSSYLALDHLAGLKRVIVEENQQWLYQKWYEYLLRDGIRNCLEGRDIDIIVPEATVD